ncbi:MAG: NAD-dependent epimerase/dehydratase family protein [Cryomorphaceae bacterium]|nr:MAG: NAD-dependent epimerase/dehydratase family protein [Cryomorphaceae bacterium]
MNKTVTLFGSTGLIGSEVLKLLINDDYFENINIISRKKINIDSKKIKNYIIDFSNIEDYKKVVNKDYIIIASIGTTQSKVNFNKIEYRKVDYDILLNIAMACKSNKASSFSFVSSAGADEKSKNFYLKLKGEIENSIMQIGLKSCLIFRPSLLLGKRNEFRFGEIIGQKIMPLVSFLMKSEYKPIKAVDVAKSIVNESKKIISGNKIYQYSEMKNLN